MPIQCAVLRLHSVSFFGDLDQPWRSIEDRCRQECKVMRGHVLDCTPPEVGSESEVEGSPSALGTI